jgi:hypothetical protein
MKGNRRGQYYTRFIELVKHDEAALEYSGARLTELLGCNEREARRAKEQYLNDHLKPRDYMSGSDVLTADTVLDNKRIGKMNYREVLGFAKGMQDVKNRASSAQNTANIYIKTKHEKIILQPLADAHLGSFGCDYGLLEEYTELLKRIPNLYTSFLGDMNDGFLAFRNQKAVFSQVLNPELQVAVYKGWIEDIQQKILWAVWDNHTQFEEAASGFNTVRDMLKHKVAYLDGIGKVTLTLNDVTYTIACTHKTRNWSSFNFTHGLKNLVRNDLPLVDIAMAGDRHVPEFATTFMQGKPITLIQSGTLKTQDSYSAQYFSFATSPAMPCVVLNTKDKLVVPFWNLRDAMVYCGLNPKDYLTQKKK